MLDMKSCTVAVLARTPCTSAAFCNCNGIFIFERNHSLGKRLTQLLLIDLYSCYTLSQAEVSALLYMAKTTRTSSEARTTESWAAS